MAETVNVHYAKTHLSQLLARVERGEEVVIARDSKPVARLVAAGRISPKLERKFGCMRGLIGTTGPEFFEPLPTDELGDLAE